MSIDASEVQGLATAFGAAGSRAEKLAQQVVGKTLLDIESDAKQIIIQKDIVDTGNMLNSVSHYWDGGLSGEVGPDANYAVFHELGTSRMPARPFMGPATDRRIPLMEQALLQIGEESLGG